MGELVLGRPIETVAAARRPCGTRSEAVIALGFRFGVVDRSADHTTQVLQYEGKMAQIEIEHQPFQIFAMSSSAVCEAKSGSTSGRIEWVSHI